MKQTIVLLALLGATLLGYATWTAEPTEVTEDGVAIFAADKPSTIDYDDNTDVRIERRTAAGGNLHLGHRHRSKTHQKTNSGTAGSTRATTQ